MKHFFRSIPGKIILFVGCVVSVTALAGCILGAFILVEGGFYEAGEEELFGREVSAEIISQWQELYNYGQYDENEDGVRKYRYDGNLILHIYDADDADDLCAVTGTSAGTATEDMILEYDAVLYSYSARFEPVWEYSVVRSQYYYYDKGLINDSDNYSFRNYRLKAAFRKGFPANDRYALIYKGIHFGYKMRYAVYYIGIAAGIIALLCFIALMCVSARRKEDDGLHPGLLHKVPFDLIAASECCLLVLYIHFIVEHGDRSMAALIAAIIAGPFVLTATLGFCMSCAARIKDGSILKNTVIWRVLKLAGKGLGFLAELFKGIPTAWKVLIFIGANAFIDLMVLLLATEHEEEGALAILVIKTLLLAGFGVFVCMKLKILKDGAAQLANGNITGQIDTKGLLPEMKKHAENLNSIGRGMNTAVEQRLKSERMKAELITNVSHDIKTPLTSIINYTGLIANESCDNNKHSQYGEVLMRQAERLKRLLEDLVEASKASTGNLDVNLAPCDAAVFVSQASGEYQEKLEAAQLSLVVKQPEENLRIMADGRRMWRIFDNLMNNICKYSLPGTRVYLTLDRFGDTARFLFKNTSRDVLDISEDELMERFVRGDASRNTEGNGLGLSIAKSMAQLQNGMLKIETDGDLFKAILMFPLIAE